jgi:hypothetical protein
LESEEKVEMGTLLGSGNWMRQNLLQNVLAGLPFRSKNGGLRKARGFGQRQRPTDLRQNLV